MSLATIIKKIEAEAEAEGQERITQARSEGEWIIANAIAEAKKEVGQIEQNAEKDLQSLKNRRMATALLQMRKERLDNRQRMLNEVFSKALKRIHSLSAEQYQTIVKNVLLSIDEERQANLLLSEADKPLNTEKFIDEVNAELKKRNRKLQFKVLKKAAEIEKGFVVDFKDFEINYSVEKILQDLWADIEGEVSKQLFEGDK